MIRDKFKTTKTLTSIRKNFFTCRIHNITLLSLLGNVTDYVAYFCANIFSLNMRNLIIYVTR